MSYRLESRCSICGGESPVLIIGGSNRRYWLLCRKCSNTVAHSPLPEDFIAHVREMVNGNVSAAKEYVKAVGESNINYLVNLDGSSATCARELNRLARRFEAEW